jgi:hypothetical protein
MAGYSLQIGVFAVGTVAFSFSLAVVVFLRRSTCLWCTAAAASRSPRARAMKPRTRADRSLSVVPACRRHG